MRHRTHALGWRGDRVCFAGRQSPVKCNMSSYKGALLYLRATQACQRYIANICLYNNHLFVSLWNSSHAWSQLQISSAKIMSDTLNKKNITYSKKALQRVANAQAELPSCILSAVVAPSCSAADTTFKPKSGTMHAYLQKLPPSVGVKRKSVRSPHVTPHASTLNNIEPPVPAADSECDAAIRTTLLMRINGITPNLLWCSFTSISDKKMRWWQCARFATCTIREVLPAMKLHIASFMKLSSMELIGRPLQTCLGTGNSVCRLFWCTFAKSPNLVACRWILLCICGSTQS